VALLMLGSARDVRRLAALRLWGAAAAGLARASHRAALAGRCARARRAMRAMRALRRAARAHSTLFSAAAHWRAGALGVAMAVWARGCERRAARAARQRRLRALFASRALGAAAARWARWARWAAAATRMRLDARLRVSRDALRAWRGAARSWPLQLRRAQALDLLGRSHFSSNASHFAFSLWAAEWRRRRRADTVAREALRSRLLRQGTASLRRSAHSRAALSFLERLDASSKRQPAPLRQSPPQQRAPPPPPPPSMTPLSALVTPAPHAQRGGHSALGGGHLHAGAIAAGAPRTMPIMPPTRSRQPGSRAVSPSPVWLQQIWTRVVE